MVLRPGGTYDSSLAIYCRARKLGTGQMLEARGQILPDPAVHYPIGGQPRTPQKLGQIGYHDFSAGWAENRLKIGPVPNGTKIRASWDDSSSRRDI